MADNLILITGDNEAEIKEKTKKEIQKFSSPNDDEFSLDIIKLKEDSTAVSLIAELNSSINTPSFFGKKNDYPSGLSILCKRRC